MTAYAPNMTTRVWYDYRVGGMDHTLMIRLPYASVEADCEAAAEKLALALNDFTANRFSVWATRGWRFALGGSDVSLPLTSPEDVDNGSASGYDASDAFLRARALSFVGRTSIGGPAGFYLYGSNLGIEGGVGKDFRITTVESANLAAMIIRLDETAPAFVGNDDSTVIWKPYVNVKHNDRYVRRIRRGG